MVVRWLGLSKLSRTLILERGSVVLFYYLTPLETICKRSESEGGGKDM